MRGRTLKTQHWVNFQLFSCDLNSFVFARKTLKNGGIKKRKESEDNAEHDEHQDNYLITSDSENNKANKRQKFIRGGKSSSQRRLLSCVPRGGVTEESRLRGNLGSRTTDNSIAGSNISRGKRRLQHEYSDQEIEGGKRRCAYMKYANNKNTDCRCFSDNGVRKGSFKDYSLPTRSKSESNVDIDVEQSQQKLLAEKTSSWNDKEPSKTLQENFCKNCQRFYNGDKDDRMTNCTAL